MSEISKAAFTQCIREVKCPHCHATPNHSCKTPSGHKYPTPHWERTKAYRDKIGPEEFDRRHRIVMNSMPPIMLHTP